MNEAVRRSVRELLRAVLGDVGARVPDSGAFPEQVWEVPLPAPHGPYWRLALQVTPREADPGCRVRVRVVSGGGDVWEVAPFFASTAAELRAELAGPEAAPAIERFLERILDDLPGDPAALRRPLDLPGVLVERDGAPFAALDPREVEVERRGPEQPASARWRLLLHRAGGWTDAGLVREQTESDRHYLDDRVRATLAAFQGLARDGFEFRVWPGPVPDHPERASWQRAGEVDRNDPVAARLRQLCRAVIDGIPNAEQALVQSMLAVGREEEREEERVEAGEPAGALARLRRSLASLFGDRPGRRG
jgi:hypothetical protein